MILSKELLFLLLVITLICCCGFYKYVYFISIGYGFSIAGAGIFMLLYFNKQLSVITMLECITLIFYGIRLGLYLLIREIKNRNYRKALKDIITDENTVSFTSKVAIWIACVLLYLFQVCPVFFGLFNKTEVNTISLVGLIIMMLGVILETAADLQKTLDKKKNPNMFCYTGLYKFVRCPNYLGEVILWTGIFVVGFNTLESIPQWIFAILGYVGILYVMLGGARRLEIRQDKSYGNNLQYKRYKSTTPILIPLIPLYSVKKYDWLKW